MNEEIGKMKEAVKPSNQAVPSGRWKFVIGGLLIVAAVAYLIISSTGAAAQYYLTIDELVARGEDAMGRDIRLSGAVDENTIVYDVETLTLRFAMANVPADGDDLEAAGGLSAALHQAVNDPNATRLEVVYVGPKPDLLRHEAQAIVTGRLGEDGVFYADELLLKCPTRYEEEVPDQVVEGQ
ncbi:MAG: cytochrome c maturation protein CcmE [Anaerolineales bacterium]